jgi:siroheme synthase/uroporphyrinogen-III synthase
MTAGPPVSFIGPSYTAHGGGVGFRPVGRGVVYLVGAGPGDPGLMTRRSLELIAAADVILYDRLIPPGALDGARPDAELRYVGKEPGAPAMEQGGINALLVELGRAGRRVVRLKGGDPFVFGRGGEEAEALADAGVAFEVVPGVTAGVAAPAYAGIPVTHREMASAVAFVTGHEDPAKEMRAAPSEPGSTDVAGAGRSEPGSTDAAGAGRSDPGSTDAAGAGRSEPGSTDAAGAGRSDPGSTDVAGAGRSEPGSTDAAGAGRSDPGAAGATALDWDALARFPGTLVFYMGIRNLPLISERLLAAGRDPRQPAAVVARGTLSGQRTVTAPLDSIAERVGEAGLEPPAVTVVGPVAGLRDTLAWLKRRPLHGQVVAVTRARAQASGLAAQLRDLGAGVLETPAIRIEPRSVLLARPERYDLICFTSPNGVSVYLDALGSDARALAGVTVAAIGPGTAAELERHGIRADVVPERSVAEGLLEALPDVRGKSVLVARAAEARDVLPDGLRERGASVHVVPLYDTVAEPLSAEQRRALQEEVTYVTFTSSSTVRFFVDGVGALPGGVRVVSIGPVTSRTLREHGMEPDVEAAQHDIDGLVTAIVEDVRR